MFEHSSLVWALGTSKLAFVVVAYDARAFCVPQLLDV